ncbi:MAG: hypothetical protein R2752_13830 [Vicinamibacterales bacterium]
MQKARYDPVNLGHFASRPRYVRTSRAHPAIPGSRRPPRAAGPRHGLDEERREELAEEMPEIARHTSERERRAADAERELVQWKKVRFMADKVGDTFDGYITGVSAFGLHRAGRDLVEGMVHDLDHGRRLASRSARTRCAAIAVAGILAGRPRRHQVIAWTERRQIDLGLTDILEHAEDGTGGGGAAAEGARDGKGQWTAWGRSTVRAASPRADCWGRTFAPRPARAGLPQGREPGRARPRAQAVTWRPSSSAPPGTSTTARARSSRR